MNKFLVGIFTCVFYLNACAQQNNENTFATNSVKQLRDAYQNSNNLDTYVEVFPGTYESFSMFFGFREGYIDLGEAYGRICKQS